MLFKFSIHLTDMHFARPIRTEAVVPGQFMTFINTDNATGRFEGAIGPAGNMMLNVNALRLRHAAQGSPVIVLS
jgi:hypothetical protein